MPLSFAEGDRFGVDAVMETFVQESNKVVQQVAGDAHPTKARVPAKPAASKPKPK